MLEAISSFLSATVDIVWGLPLIVLLLGGGLGLFIYSGLLPLRGFFHAFRLVMGRFHHPGDQMAEGQLSHFQALTNALAATIGLGNIAGVAVAITQGGPGAVFWMWMAAFIGMNTKFFECTLAVMFRGHDYRGEVQGGPMYVISQSLPKPLRWMAWFFAICGMIGCMALFQVNQLSIYLQEQYSLEPLWVGLISAAMVAVVLKGGVRRLGKVTSSLVPTMAVIYFVGSLFVILLNMGKVPGLLMLILSDAFTGEAMFGGAVGYGVLEVIKVGAKRAAFSNEAGVGTAPMAHGNAKTNEPISEGFVAMLGPFFDTMVICTMTALVILITLPLNTFQDVAGITITVQAFESVFPGYGSHFLGISVILFSFTTMLGMANYNEKCWNFVFRGRWGLGENTFIVVFCTTLVIGAVSAVDNVVNLLDIGYGLMAYPNMVATIFLAPKVKRALKDYFVKFKV